MPRVKQASKQKRTTKPATAKVLGAAGLSFSLVGSASASTTPTAGISQTDNTSPTQRFILNEEEMADVSLATFYVFDRENVGIGVQLARGCGGCGHGGGCGGCAHGGGGCAHVGGGCAGHVGGGCAGLRGCAGAGFRGCRGCGGFRGCRGFRGCGCGGCGGCGVGIWFDDDIGWGGGCCVSWGACRLC